MDPFPLPETVRYNLVLHLPKLLAGEVVKSEISDDLGPYPSFWEERIKAVTAILEIEAKDWELTRDEQGARQQFECTIKVERWYFSWDAGPGEELRIPPRNKWERTSEDNRYYVVNLDVEMAWSPEDLFVIDGITIGHIEPVFELTSVSEHARHHLGEGLKKLKSSAFTPGPFGIFPEDACA